MNPSVVNVLHLLLGSLLALARTPQDSENVEIQQTNLKNIRDQIRTFHGDSEVADPKVLELIRDLETVVSTSAPSEEYAEEPTEELWAALEVQEVEGAEPESEEGEAAAEQEEQQEEPTEEELAEQAEAQALAEQEAAEAEEQARLEAEEEEEKQKQAEAAKKKPVGLQPKKTVKK